ncbi:MAG: ABC transporter ATP-binding protein [Bdellovibrionales bacterium]|nr:ABC transporter ATP-binding protein [Bdellovibrionales bacterium]
MIEFKHITKKYKTNALENVSFKIAAGEFVTVLGPSGSGKSTILKLLTGIESPTQGDIIVEGKSIINTPIHKRKFGLVFQDYGLFPHMTVYDNIAFALKAHNCKEIPKIVAMTIQRVELDEMLLTKYPSELSGGQQQRVALARAITLHPKVMLFDEPLSALDKNLRKQLQQEIRRIHHQTSATSIYVTHDQSEAFALSDKVIVLNNGAVQQIGTPHEIYYKPKNLFVARFVSDIAILEGTYIRSENIKISSECDYTTAAKVLFSNFIAGNIIITVLANKQKIEIINNEHKESNAIISIGWDRSMCLEFDA